MTTTDDTPVRGPYPVLRPRDVPEHARPAAGECAVLRLGTQLQPLPKGELPTSGMGWFRPRGEYWIIDLRERTSTLEVELDSADSGLRFHGTVDVDWQVRDARRAAEQGPIDVPRMLKRRLLPRLTSAARGYGMDEVGELESWIRRESFGGVLAEPLELLEISCVLRPDTEATDITRTGRLDTLKRNNAAAILNDGEIGLMTEALARDPDAAVEFYRNLREDKKLAMLAHLEIAKAVTGSNSSEEHERAHAINELLKQVRGSLPASATELPPAPSPSGPRQLGGGRPRRRDRRGRGRGSGQDSHHDHHDDSGPGASGDGSGEGQDQAR